MNNRELLIKKLDKYLRLVRFKYTDLEKLERLHILDDYYKTLNLTPSVEKMSSVLESSEALSSDLKMPLKVRGIFLTVGRHKKKFYTEDELIKSVSNPINQKIPLCLDHRDSEVGSIIGVVDKLEYDPSIKGIRWYGHLNSEQYARNVLDGVITDVSATIYSTSDYGDNGLEGRELVYKELSLVWDGACKDAMVEVDI